MLVPYGSRFVCVVAVVVNFLFVFSINGAVDVALNGYWSLVVYVKLSETAAAIVAVVVAYANNGAVKVAAKDADVDVTG